MTTAYIVAKYLSKVLTKDNRHDVSMILTFWSDALGAKYETPDSLRVLAMKKEYSYRILKIITYKDKSVLTVDYYDSCGSDNHYSFSAYSNRNKLDAEIEFNNSRLESKCCK